MQRNRIAEELETLIRARYPLIYVVTWEEPRLDTILSSIAARRGKKLFVWSISRGLLPFGTPLQSKKIDEATRDPAVALDRVVEHVEPAIFCFKDFHPFMTDPVIVRKLRELAQYLKSTYTTVVLSSPTQRIPMELEKDIAVVEFGLPDANELRDLLERTIEEVSRSTPIKIQMTEEEKERIVQAALGLTLSEAENVFAKTLIKRGGLGAEHLDVIISEKEQIVRKSGLLDYYHSAEKFDDIGGLDLLKDWLRKRQMAFSERAREYGLPTPKGVLLIGVQGCGKSIRGDERVIILKNGQVEFPTIADLYASFEGNEMALTLNPENFRCEFRPIIAVTRHRSEGKLLKVTTVSGRTVVATHDHSFLTLDKQGHITSIPGSSLDTKTFLPVLSLINLPVTFTQVPINFVRNPYNRNPKFTTINELSLNWFSGFLIGAYLSEGIAVERRIEIHNDDILFQQTLLSALRHLGLAGKATERKVTINSVALCNWLATECGTGAENKRVPSFAYTAPEDFKSGLLCGYFSGDGTFSLSQRNLVDASFTTKSLLLGIGIGLLLANFGIVITIRVRGGSGKYANQKYFVGRLEVSSILPFAELIGLRHSRKQKTLERIVNVIRKKHRFERYRKVPLSIEAINDLARTHHLNARGSKGRKLIANLRSKAHYGALGITALSNLLAKLPIHGHDGYFQQLQKLLSAGVFWDRVKKIEEVTSEEWVYDITVEGNSNFCLANGLFVHNSLTAKAVASLWKVPLLRLDMSRIFSSLVGASEENLRNALRVAESVAPCVTGDTLITLADGRQIPIAQLYEQATEHFKVVAFDEKTLKLTTADVIAITRRPCPDDLYEVRLLHSVVKATGNHRFPVLRDGKLVWVRADELKVGDFIACPNRLPAKGNNPVKSLHFLPPNTRLYSKSLFRKFESHISKLPKSQTRKIRSQLRLRRYAGKRRENFVKVSEALSFGFEIPWHEVKHFAHGRGGFTDSRLMTLKEFLDEDLCYLLGLLTADGHFLKNNKGIGFTNSEPALLEAFNTIANSWFGKEPFKVELPRPQEGNQKILSKRVCYQLRLNSRLISDFLQNVQASIAELPERLIAAWLSGVIDGDGSIIVRPPKIVFSAYSQTLNEQIRVCLHRLGIVTYRTFERTGKGNTIYNGHITVTGTEYVKQLGQMLCLRHPEKSKRLSVIMKKDACSQRSRLDSIPVGAVLKKVRKILNLGQHKFAKTNRGLISYYERGLLNPSKARLQSLVQEMERWAQKNGFNLPEELQWLRTLAFGDIVWMPVKEVKRIPPTDFVYDLVCKEHHNFVANGVFTHNCILWVDELEKSFAGAQSSALSDAGTTARVLGYFLTWLQEKTAPCFVIATANSIEQLPPELLRKGRLDEIFFVDLPSKRERMEIFAIHLRKRKRDPSRFDLEALAEASQGFSGAEIEQAVISALYDAFSEGRDITTEDILKAIQETVPLSVTMKEQIDALREWASGRARRASSEESEEVPVMPMRRLEL